MIPVGYCVFITSGLTITQSVGLLLTPEYTGYFKGLFCECCILTYLNDIFLRWTNK